MKKLNEAIVQFFHEQGFVIVSTLDKDGSIHNSCKGIVDIDKNGKIYLLDLYRKTTFENLKRNPNISITAVDEHRFKGFCLKGKAKEIKTEKLSPDVLKAWEQKISGRITQRVIKNVKEDKSQAKHPEVFLPHPEYLIVTEIKEVIDLTPGQLKL